MKKLIIHLKWIKYYWLAIWYLYFVQNFTRRFLKRSWNQLWPTTKLCCTKFLEVFDIKYQLLNPHKIDLSKQYIIGANHRSWFDQISLVVALPKPIRILSKVGYFRIPIFGHAMRHNVGAIAVEKELSLNYYQQLCDHFSKGDSALFFLEGTRGRGPKLLPIKNGALKYSMKFGIPILPIFIMGSEEILCKYNKLSSVKSGTITLIIEKPVTFTKKGFKKQKEEFKNWFIETHDRYYAEYYK